MKIETQLSYQKRFTINKNSKKTKIKNFALSFTNSISDIKNFSNYFKRKKYLN